MSTIEPVRTKRRPKALQTAYLLWVPKAANLRLPAIAAVNGPKARGSVSVLLAQGLCVRRYALISSETLQRNRFVSSVALELHELEAVAASPPHGVHYLRYSCKTPSL